MKDWKMIMGPRYIFMVLNKKKFVIFSIIASILLITLAFLNYRYANYDIDCDFMDAAVPTSKDFHDSPKLAIIIDDFGEDRNGVKEMMEINRPLTFAIMPFMEFSTRDAIKAKERGFEVIVHLPMESNGGRVSWVGPRPIKTSLSDEQIKDIVTDSFESVPFAIGTNVHMGSKAGGNRRVLTSILEVLKEKGIYFVDSRSCRNPIGRSVAESVGVKFAERNVFLEHSSKIKDKIKKQLRLAAEIAINKGSAIAIGHVGNEGGKVTAQAIAEMIPEIENQGVELVFASQLVR